MCVCLCTGSLCLSMLGVRTGGDWSLYPCAGCLWGFSWIGGDPEEFLMVRRRGVRVCVHAHSYAWGLGSAHLV